jgi:hypothetical protein
MIATIKLWVFVSLWIWLILLWKWDWTKKVLGVKKIRIEEEDRPWWKVPKWEWAEKEPSYLDAAWFSLAWPFLLCALAGFAISYLFMRLSK